MGELNSFVRFADATHADVRGDGRKAVHKRSVAAMQLMRTCEETAFEITGQTKKGETQLAHVRGDGNPNETTTNEK